MSLVTSGKSQTIFYVQNMANEVHFYRDILGLKIIFPHELENYREEMWVEFSLGDHSLALHGGSEALPDEQHEIVFWVADVAQAREMIIKAGIVMNEIRELEDGSPIAEGKDPDGHQFAIRS